VHFSGQIRFPHWKNNLGKILVRFQRFCFALSEGSKKSPPELFYGSVLHFSHMWKLKTSEISAKTRFWSKSIFFPERGTFCVAIALVGICLVCLEASKIIFNDFFLFFSKIYSWIVEFRGRFMNFVWWCTVKYERFGGVHVVEHHQIDFSQLLESKTKHRRARKTHFPGSELKIRFFPYRNVFFFLIEKNDFFLTESYTDTHRHTDTHTHIHT